MGNSIFLLERQELSSFFVKTPLSCLFSFFWITTSLYFQVLQIGVITQSQGTPFSDKNPACPSTCWAMRSPHRRDTTVPCVCVLPADSTQGVKNPVRYSPEWCSCCPCLPLLPRPSLHKTLYSLRAAESGHRAHPAQIRLDNQSPLLAVFPPAHLVLPLPPPLCWCILTSGKRLAQESLSQVLEIWKLQ